MSFAHLRLNKIEQDKSQVEYLVESFDFNEEKEWEKVGKLAINTAAKNYEFQPAKIWSDRSIIPPEVFGLDETERKQVIESEYRDYGWGVICQKIIQIKILYNQIVNLNVRWSKNDSHRNPSMDY